MLGRSPQATCDGGVLFREVEDRIRDRENFGQGLPPELSSFRQLCVNFGEVDRADSRIHQDSGDLVCSCLSIEKRQYGGGIENVSTHAPPRHAARRATRRRASVRVPDTCASTPAPDGSLPALLPASGGEVYPQPRRLASSSRSPGERLCCGRRECPPERLRPDKCLRDLRCGRDRKSTRLNSS